MTSSNIINHQLDDHQKLLYSQYYPAAGVYSLAVPQQGDEVIKPRRRRKKNKESNTTGFRKKKLSQDQVNLLEESFGSEHKLESERKDRLALELGLDPRQVAVWFQNRRARWKSKKLEEEYSKLKGEHETAVVEKCRLESEVLKLKEQLREAEKEIHRLSECSSSNSPSSSFSMEAQFLEEFSMGGGLEDVFYVPEMNNYNTSHSNGFWVNFYDM